MLITHTIVKRQHVPLVQSFQIFSRGTIIFIQASFVILLILFNHNSKAMSDLFPWVNFSTFVIHYYFCQFKLFQLTIVDVSFFKGREPDILSTSVCAVVGSEVHQVQTFCLPGVCCRDCWELQGQPRVSVSVAPSPAVTLRQARSYKMLPPKKNKNKIKNVLEHNNSSCLAMSSPASVRRPSVRNAECTNQMNEV